MKIKSSIVLSTLLFVGLLSAVGQEERYSGLYELQVGDTPESVAEKLLGDATLATALLTFNKLDAESFGSRTKQFIAVPKQAIEDSTQALLDGEAALERARAAQAEKYATTDLKEAELLLELAGVAHRSGAFNKAQQQSALAVRRSGEALALSDQRAMKPMVLRVEAASYSVEAEMAGSTRRLLTLNDRVSGVRRLTTTSGRALILLGDNTTVLLHADTVFILESSEYDERTKVETLRVRVERGRFEWERLKANLEASVCEFSVGGDVVRVDESIGLLAQLGGGASSLNVFEGTLTLADALRVAGGSGVVWRGTEHGEVLALPETPVLEEGDKGFSFSDQTPVLPWPVDSHPEGLLELIADDGQGVFVSLLQQKTASDVAVTLDFLPVGDYLLRLIGYSSKGLFSLPSVGIPLKVTLDLGVDLKLTPAALETNGTFFVSDDHLIYGKPSKADTSVVSIEYQDGDAAYKALEDGFILFKSGVHTVRMRGVSMRGEKGPVVERRFFVDKRAPDVQFIVQTGVDPDTGMEQTLLSLEARDDQGVASIEFKVGDGAFVPYERVMTLRLDAATTFVFRATDRVGNVSRPRSLVLLP